MSESQWPANSHAGSLDACCCVISCRMCQSLLRSPCLEPECLIVRRCYQLSVCTITPIKESMDLAWGLWGLGFRV